MVNMQVHTGYFSIVNLRLKIKLTYNQSTRAASKMHNFLNSQFCLLFHPLTNSLQLLWVGLFTITTHSKWRKTKHLIRDIRKCLTILSFIVS